MADQTDYKHITVNPDTNDDIVIVAGAPASNPENEVQEQGAATKSHEESAAAKPKAHVEESPKAQAQGKGSTSNNPDYHPTTLKDIQESKMSKTQVIVIALAIIAIAAFVIWYFAFS